MCSKNLPGMDGSHGYHNSWYYFQSYQINKEDIGLQFLDAYSRSIRKSLPSDLSPIPYSFTARVVGKFLHVPVDMKLPVAAGSSSEGISMAARTSE